MDVSCHLKDLFAYFGRKDFWKVILMDEMFHC